MPLPFVPRSTADALRERIVFLESELARVNSRNDELVNALAATNRAVVPFQGAIQHRAPVAVKSRAGADQVARGLERKTASNVRYPFPLTPEFDKMRQKQESGGAPG